MAVIGYSRGYWKYNVPLLKFEWQNAEHWVINLHRKMIDFFFMKNSNNLFELSFDLIKQDRPECLGCTGWGEGGYIRIKIGVNLCARLNRFLAPLTFFFRNYHVHRFIQF
jgi:hypothetical protein